MDAENQTNIKKIAEGERTEGSGNENIIVVLGASDLEGAENEAFPDANLAGCAVKKPQIESK